MYYIADRESLCKLMWINGLFELRLQFARIVALSLSYQVTPLFRIPIETRHDLLFCIVMVWRFLSGNAVQVRYGQIEPCQGASNWRRSLFVLAVTLHYFINSMIDKDSSTLSHTAARS